MILPLNLGRTAENSNKHGITKAMKFLWAHTEILLLQGGYSEDG